MYVNEYISNSLNFRFKMITTQNMTSHDFTREAPTRDLSLVLSNISINSGLNILQLSK